MSAAVIVLLDLNPGQPETNPDQSLEWHLNPGQPHPNPTHTVQAPPRISARTFKRWININHLLNWAHLQGYLLPLNSS